MIQALCWSVFSAELLFGCLGGNWSFRVVLEIAFQADLGCFWECETRFYFCFFVQQRRAVQAAAKTFCQG